VNKKEERRGGALVVSLSPAHIQKEHIIISFSDSGETCFELFF
jgi:hypothetical protein